MNIIKKFPKEEQIVDINEINIEKIKNTFVNYNFRIIFVTDDNVLVGIITEGNCKRALLEEGELISKKYTYLYDSEEEKAKTIFYNNIHILEIPIINAQGELCYYYQNIKSDKEEKNTKNIRKIVQYYKNSTYYSPNNIIQLFGVEKCLMRKTECFIDDVILDMFSVDVCVIDRSEDITHTMVQNTMVIDMLADDMEIMQETEGYIIINSNLFLHILELNEKSIEKRMYAIAGLYQSIGIKGENKVSNLLYDYVTKNKELKAYKLDETSFLETKAGKSYIACENIDVIVDCNIQQCTYSNKYCISLIHFLVTALALDLPSENTKSMYYDLKYNIVPKLAENNVDVIFMTFPVEKRCTQKINFKASTVGKTGNSKQWEAFLGGLGRSEEVESILFGDQYGFLSYVDHNSKNVHYNNLQRTTIGNFIEGYNNILLYGPCTIFGIEVTDEETIATYLQEKVTEYNIVNRGGVLHNTNFMIRSGQYRAYDKIIIMVEESLYQFRKSDKVIDIMEAYNRIPDLQSCVWHDLLHCNKVVNQSIAEIIYEYLKENDLLRPQKNDCKGDKILFSSKEYKDFFTQDIKNNIDEWMINNNINEWKLNGNIGSIVMNCNPFTNGHKFLIEEAAKQVDNLIVFVVEEDRSFFPFAKRLELVKQCTRHLKNVKVIPSGQYIISLLTMPGYFEKEALQDKKVDLSSDIEIFGKYIAPRFHITKRFAGEEPYDLFTRQYNQTMKELLPKYGITFVEIERKKYKNDAVSASLVRKYLLNKEYEKIKDLVPPEVYSYLTDENFDIKMDCGEVN